MRKIFVLSLAIVLLLGCLSGCGEANNAGSSNTETSSKNNQGDFRNIPFGTKYNEAMELMKEDLKEQKYNTAPEENHLSTEFPIVEWKNIKLYEYNADADLSFYNEKDTGNAEDSIFYFGSYTIQNESDEDAEACYNFFYDKLKEKYGSGEQYESHDDAFFSANTNGIKWNTGGSSVSIYRTIYEPIDRQSYKVYITYSSPEIRQRISDDYNKSKEVENNNINGGL